MNYQSIFSRKKPAQRRKWRLWQIESSFDCNLRCIMCPWQGERKTLRQNADMSREVWLSLVPYLREVDAIDFSGGGEPLLQKNLLFWIQQAKESGCETGFLTNGLLLEPEICQRLVDTRLDWIGISMDGADAPTYEKIRRGSDFERVCQNIKTITSVKSGQRPRVIVQFVIMKENAYQIEAFARLAERLKVDQINFKQCDVIRGKYGKEFGVFASTETKETHKTRKSLSKAIRWAEKRHIQTNSFSFIPDEQPVCDQDPRRTLFIRYDGTVSSCVSRSRGGPSEFLGQEVTLPTVHYGKLPEEDLRDIWESEPYSTFRDCFENRLAIYNRVLYSSDYSSSLFRMKKAFQDAAEAMPEAPEGCLKCHYLYGI